MRRAVIANMRPSWPLPRTPIVEPGRMGWEARFKGPPAFRSRQFLMQGSIGLFRPILPEFLSQFRTRDREDGHCEEGRVGRPWLADGQGAHRDASRHLYDRQQRIHTLKRGTFNRTPEYREA